MKPVFGTAFSQPTVRDVKTLICDTLDKGMMQILPG